MGISTERNKTRRWAILLTTASVTVVGCDNADHANDVGVREALTRAQTAIVQGGPTATTRKIDDSPTPAESIATAAKTESISPELKAQARAALAQLSLGEARRQISAYGVHELALSQAVWDLRQLVQQVSTSTTLAKGYARYDPKVSRDQIQKFIVAAQGGPGQDQWFTNGEAKLPTLSAVRQTISELEGKISQKQEAIQGLTQQQTAAAAEAEQATTSSQAATGEKALEEFKRSAELRRKVSVLSIQKDGVTAELEPLQKDLAVAQGNQAVLTSVITAYQKQQASLETSWKAIQTQAAEQQKLSKQVSEGSSDSQTTARSIAQRVAELPALVKASDDARNQAITSLDDAVKYFADAAESAKGFQAKLQEMINAPGNEARPEKAAWAASLVAIDPERYKLQQASAQQTLATIHGRKAAELDSLAQLQKSLTATLDAASLAVPSEISSAEYEAARKSALAAANEAFNTANELLNGLADAGNRPKDVSDSALVQQMLTLYSWASLNSLEGDTVKAKEHLELAGSLRKNADEKQIVLPSLPPELGGSKVTTSTPAATSKPAEVSALPPENSDEKAIRDMIVGLKNAVDAGDLSLAMQALDASSEESSVQMLIDFTAAQKKLTGALKAKFADDGEKVGQAIQSPLQGMLSSPISVSGDTAKFRGGASAADQPDAKKVDGQWKLVIREPTTDGDKLAKAVGLRLLKTFSELADEVAADKFPDLSAFSAEMRTRVSSAMKGDPSPGTPSPGDEMNK